jgi:para-aminobenzoate synthetase component 1
MKPLVVEMPWREPPETVARRISPGHGVALLRSGSFDTGERYSLLAARPFLTFRSYASRCELSSSAGSRAVFGNPWEVLNRLLARYELLDEIDFPFPLGGCFGSWGYDLKNFVEPTVPRGAVNDLGLPDCALGCYDSLVVFDHLLSKVWIVSTGLREDGSRCGSVAAEAVGFWREMLGKEGDFRTLLTTGDLPDVTSNFTREAFVNAVRQALSHIRRGDIYQVNVAQRLRIDAALDARELYSRLLAVSPAPFSAYFDFGDWQLVSSSPELFLKLNGSAIRTRPIKGTRPRSRDPERDAQLTYELQTSTKEMAELVMITDLLRNDLGRVCEYGSVRVPDLVRLEKYPQVQHLVSTVEGRLRSGLTHLDALGQCFPGGSITGAPKVRAMQIIDELEPVTRGPYTGAHGYLGFNRESLLSISIRSATVQPKVTTFHVGAGIVADSDPALEYEETMAKARGFIDAIHFVDSRPAGGASGPTKPTIQQMLEAAQHRQGD